MGLLIFGWGDVLLELVCCLFLFGCLGLSLCCLFFFWLLARSVVQAWFRCVFLFILRLFVWCVSWFCVYVDLEGGSVFLILGLVLLLLLLFNMISAYFGCAIAGVYRFLVFILLSI